MPRKIVRSKPSIPTTMVIKLIEPVWLETHKGKAGEIVALDTETAKRLVQSNHAVEYSDD